MVRQAHHRFSNGDFTRKEAERMKFAVLNDITRHKIDKIYRLTGRK